MNGLSWFAGLFMNLNLLAGVSAQTVESSAQTVIQQATERLYAAIQHDCETRTLHPENLFPLVDAILLPHADFQRMSRLVMGKHWKRLSDSQRQQFMQEFKALLIRTYATAIHSVSPEDIRYLPERNSGAPERNSGAPDKTVVRTEVRPEGMAAIPVHYNMYRKNGRWLVYDVRIEGISLITNYRSTFSAGIKATGVAGLIVMLKQKNSQHMEAATTDNGHTAVVSRC